MLALLVTTAIACQSQQRPETPRKPNPFAPSLRELTDDEEKKLDTVIDRFIAYDTGKLRGSETKQALTDFQKLGPDAIPALIRGLNRAAKIDHSCPAVTIAKKLSRMLSSSRDAELLEFARENIGAGITQSRHMGVVKDLRVLCMVRKNAVLRSGEVSGDGDTSPALQDLRSLSTPPRSKPVRAMTLEELIEAAGSERGLRLKMVVTELGRRPGDLALDAVGTAAATYEGDVQQLARETLMRRLSDLGEAALREKLKDDHAEVRAAAARVVASKGWHWEKEMVDLLDDEESIVRETAHQTLVRFAKGTDFGPKRDASESERKEAEQRWRAWLAKQNGR